MLVRDNPNSPTLCYSVEFLKASGSIVAGGTSLQAAVRLELLLLLLLFTAIGFAAGGSSPTLVHTKTMK
jgi:hypothetical protein